MVQSDIKTHHLKHLGSLGSEMLQNNAKTNHLQPFKRHPPRALAFQASLNDTFRRVWALQNSLNDTLRGLLGRTPYDVQITLDAQETRLVLSNTLRMEIRPAGE